MKNKEVTDTLEKLERDAENLIKEITKVRMEQQQVFYSYLDKEIQTKWFAEYPHIDEIKLLRSWDQDCASNIVITGPHPSGLSVTIESWLKETYPQWKQYMMSEWIVFTRD